MTLLRYNQTSRITSGQDPFSDVIDWLGFLTAKDYLVDLLRQVHGIGVIDARSRAKQIIPHVRIAMRYIQQSREGPADISFLPAYYAILNLMKVYILLGPRHADLAKHRWHGATYNVHGKENRSILTDAVTFKKGGVFPLFYETLTSKVLTTSELRLQLRDVLPYVAGVTHEYTLATGEASKIYAVTFDYAQQSNSNAVYPHCSVLNFPESRSARKNELKLLRGFRARRGKKNTFVGKSPVTKATAEAETREQLNTYLIYRMHPDYTYTAICSRRLELPEELPIAILFSTCRQWFGTDRNSS